MTEKEIIERQEENGNTLFYVMQIGMFYHAYGYGAFALSRITGYHVRLVHRRTLHDVCVCGFPVKKIDTVVQKMLEQSVVIDYLDDKNRLFSFSGADGTPDETMITETGKEDGEQMKESTSIAAPRLESLLDEIRSFNVAASTPMDAMILISKLQKDYEEV